ncbi:group II decarboxylase [Aspergillus luchuensis]|uniref:Group II decarboxylase n=1 Tax=Aspergillus kawachii TaxID=1069201 RepID=A0A146FB65_ASPKA|nr:group II decarboxylase [Aspergillus luchuensis]
MQEAGKQNPGRFGLLIGSGSIAAVQLWLQETGGLRLCDHQNVADWDFRKLMGIYCYSKSLMEES